MKWKKYKYSVVLIIPTLLTPVLYQKFQMKLRRKRMESTRKDEKEIMCDYGPL